MTRKFDFLNIKSLVLSISKIISLSILIYLLFYYIKNEIDYFTPENIDQSETPTQILNHANTMYWYSRSIGNSFIEFEESKKLSVKALNMLEESNDSFTRILKVKAEKIIDNADSSMRQNLLTVNNRYPYFLDFVGLNNMAEEDQMNENMDIFATKKVLEKLVESPDVLSSKYIKEVPYFTLIVHNTKNVELEEAAAQILNLNTKLYTISNHEIAEIYGSKNFDVDKLVKDTVFLEKVRKYFNCGQISIINVNKNDQYNSVYYYGARFSVYAPETGRYDLNRYVETFVKARGYNNTLSNMIPLFLIFILVLFLGVELAKILNFLVIKWDKYWLNLLVSGGVAATINIIIIETLIYFFIPESGEFIETDKSLIWIFLVACCFSVIPTIVVHLVLGKLDRLIFKFDSALDKREGLFFIIWPALSTYGLALSYYSIIRFGFSKELWVVAYAYFTAFVLSLLITYYWMRLKEMPEKTILIKKLLVYIPVFYSIGAAIAYPWFTFGIINLIELQHWFINITVIPLIISGLIYIVEKIGFVQFFIKNKKLENEVVNEVAFEIEEKMFETIKQEKALVIYGAKQMGKTCLTKRLSKTLVPFGNKENIITIDFSIKQEIKKNKINYYPFAYGFANFLPFSAFNDHAEEAKKSGNIIGKILSAISSAGSFLVDDSESVPTEINKITELLFTNLRKHKISLLIFENIHEAEDESKELLLMLLKKFYEYVRSLDKENENHLPYLIFTSLNGFHIKRKFEILIENYTNCLRLNKDDQEKQIFYDLTFEKEFLRKYVQNLKLYILDEEKLFQKIAGNNKYNSPGYLFKIIEAMKEKNMLIQANGYFKLKLLKNDIALPEIVEELEPFEEVINKLDKELLNLLQSCAYASLPNGNFEINVVCYLMEKNRIEILQLLKIAEDINFVYDLKHKDDWYSFNDIRYMLALKKIDGNNVKEVSQLGKEYYARWVEYYWQKKDFLFSNVLLNKNILIGLIDKSYAIKDSHSELSYEILKQLGFLFCEPKFSMLEKSELSFDRALAILDKYKNKFVGVNSLDIEINGLLKTLDAKNELNLPKAQAILDKVKLGVNLSKDQLLYIQYIECLAFSKSQKYNKNQANIYITKNKELINKLSPDDVKNKFQLNFVNLLLSPKGGASLNDLNNILSDLESNIKAIQQYSNLLEIQKQMLNYSAGVIIDNILGAVKSNLNFEQDLFYVNKAFSLLFYRLKLELNSECDIEQYKDISYESFIITLFELHKNEILIANKEFSLDRKGLSYTYNYIVRLIYFLLDKKTNDNLTEIKNIGVNLADYAEKLNKEVNDQSGIIMSLSFNGLIKILAEENGAAFRKFEEAYVYSFHNMNDFQMSKSIENMEKIDKKFLLKKDENLLAKYKQIALYRHILRHFEIKSFDENKINQMITENYIISEDDLIKLTSVPGSKFDSLTFSDPKQVLKKVSELRKTCVLKKEFNTEYLEEELDENVGFLNILPIKEIPKNYTVQVEKRGDIDVKVVEGIKPPKTNFLFVAFYNNEIKTACPGNYAPKFHNQINDEIEKKESINYWENHVFIKSQ